MMSRAHEHIHAAAADPTRQPKPERLRYATAACAINVATSIDPQHYYIPLPTTNRRQRKYNEDRAKKVIRGKSAPAYAQPHANTDIIITGLQTRVLPTMG